MTKRVEKEIQQLKDKPQPGVKFLRVREEGGVPVVEVMLSGAPGSLYEGEEWTLRFILKNYPFESPSTYFVAPPVPGTLFFLSFLLSRARQRWSTCTAMATSASPFWGTTGHPP